MIITTTTSMLVGLKHFLMLLMVLSLTIVVNNNLFEIKMTMILITFMTTIKLDVNIIKTQLECHYYH